MPGDVVAEKARAEDDEGVAEGRARPSRRHAGGVPGDGARDGAGDAAPAAEERHPGRTPALLTLAVTVVLVGVGWLTQGRDDTPTRLAVPMGAEAGGGDDDSVRAGGDGDTDGDGVGESAAGTPLGVSRDGEPAYVLANWLDVPLVAPAAAIRPDALGTLIPIVPFTGMPASADGTAGSTGGGTGSGTGSGPGDAPPGEGGTTSTTLRPGTPPGGPGATVTPTSTPTTTAPDTVPSTTAPPDTVPPTTAPPDTLPPTTAPPDTTPPPTNPPPTGGDGLLGVVGDLLTGTVNPLLGL